MAKDIKRHISHLKSSGTTAPAADDLVYGEIAVGYGAGNEVLYIKNSSDAIIPFVNGASALAEAELYADSGFVSTVTSDSALTTSLSEKASSGRTLSINHTSRTAQSGFKKLSTDDYGHVTAGTDVALSDLTGLGAVSSARTITTNQGLTGGGNLSSDLTIGHSNQISAGTAKTSTTAATTIGTGNTAVGIPEIVYDANGHITSTSETTVNLNVAKATTNDYGVVKVATTTGDNNTDVVMTQSAVTKAIEDSFTLQDAMRYKGTLTGKSQFEGLTDYQVGDTYKVAAEFTTTSGVKLEIGDMVIAQESGATFDVDDFNFIQANLDPTAYVVTTRSITAGTGLTGGGDLSADRTISLATTGTAGTYYAVKTDDYGRVISGSSTNPNTDNYITGATVTTAASNVEVALSGNNNSAKANAQFTIPNATTSAAGVMTSADKTVLDNLTPLTGNASTLSAITASAAAINSLTGTVGTMAFENTSSYSSATEVNTALAGKSDTGHTHSEYENQDAFSNVKVGSTTIEADSATDTIEFAVTNTTGTEGLTISADATNDKVTLNLGDIVCGDYA